MASEPGSALRKSRERRTQTSQPSPDGGGRTSHRVRTNPERVIGWLMLVAAAPGAFAALYIVWSDDYTFEVRWTVTSAVVVMWIGATILARRVMTRVLNVVANLLGALREGDYSIRGVAAGTDSAVELVMLEINGLGDVLQRQRAEAVESTALLSSVMAAIDVAVFTFDTEHCLRLVNRAGERLLGRSAAWALGKHATEIGFEAYLAGPTPRMLDGAFGADSSRFELRRSVFRKDGRQHHLIVLADLSRALREEEQNAWQRIVRVLSHEINNSLTPIKSIAHSLNRIIGRTPDLPRAAEIQDGLSLIETRSGALGRFLRSYAQLARLPKPQLRPVPVEPLINRIVELEKRLPVEHVQSPEVTVVADQDQLEQLLINIVRNAVDAAMETGGGVQIGTRQTNGWAEIAVDDEGKGLPDTSNLFVPFFTTKPNGSGIGLALSRQIAEAHGGSLSLENRPDRQGCRAVLRLPVQS